MGKKLICIPFFIILISCFNNPNKIKVASLFSDGMVLQRNNKVDIWGTSTPNLNIRIQPGIKVENEKQWRQALTRNMLKSNLWSVNENSVNLNKDALFRSLLELPSNVITGQFEVKILHFRNSKLVTQQINSINVSKSGISAEIYDIAQNYSTLYGIFAVFLAVLVGWVSNLIFRKV